MNHRSSKMLTTELTILFSSARSVSFTLPEPQESCFNSILFIAGVWASVLHLAEA